MMMGVRVLTGKLKVVLIPFFVIILCCISCSKSKKPGTEPETAKIVLSKSEEKSLVALGQLWGFLKYHHPAVANGDYDWDSELIQLIPLVYADIDESTWKKQLDDWLNNLPPVPANANKKSPDLEAKTRPDYGELFNTDYFFPETIDKIKHIIDNSMISTNHYVSVDNNGRLSFENELPYEESVATELPYRLLALFRLWNIVNYFFPYRDLCDQPWSEVLAEMLPDFINEQDLEQYTLTCLKLAVKIDDSHVSLLSVFMPKINGLLKVPFETRFIEGDLAVTVFTREDTYVNETIKTGDIITAIEGEDIEDIVKKMWNFTPASNDAVKLREIASKILSGNTDSVSITVSRDGNYFEAMIPRFPKQHLNIPDYYYHPYPEKEGYTILDNNIGYVLPSNCTFAERDKGIKKVLDGTKGVIIDMRCYPDDNMAYSFVANLKENRSSRIHSMQICDANISYPGFFYIRKFQETKVFPIYSYVRKIVVIVNEYTQSQAEDMVLAFQTVPNATVIGNTTAGADGNICYFFLPGNIRVIMTGKGVYYPDGSDLQRVGVKIDETVKPTIAGIKAGRDELLERAIEIINTSD